MQQPQGTLPGTDFFMFLFLVDVRNQKKWNPSIRGNLLTTCILFHGKDLKKR